MPASRLAFLTLLFGLALGLGTGFMLFSGRPAVAGASPSKGGNAVERGATSKAPPAPDSPDVLAAVGDSPPTGQGATATSRGSLSNEARQAARRVSARTNATETDTSDWNHSISGSVVDATGAAIPGATVISNNSFVDYTRTVLAMGTNKAGRAYQGVPNVEESIAKSAQRTIDLRRRTRTVEPNAAGEFVLAGLRSGTHHLIAYAEGYIFEPVKADSGTTARLVGREVATFALDVRLVDGSQPTKAIVVVQAQPAPMPYEWTPADPELRLGSRNVELQVFAGNVRKVDWRTTVADQKSSTRTIDLDRDGAGPHRMDLERGQFLRVTVTGASDGEAAIGTWVKAAAAGGDTDWTSRTITSLSREAGGVYTVMGLAEGSYVIAVGRGGSAPELTLPVQVVPGVTEVEATLGELNLSRFVIVRCQTSGGEAVTGATVNGRWAGARGAPTEAVEQGMGEYWLAAGAPPKNESSAMLAVTAMNERYGKIVQEIDANTRELAVTFQEPAELAVQVVGDTSAGYTVRLQAKEMGAFDPYSLFSKGQRPTYKKLNVDGRAQFSGLQPGDYTAELIKTGLGDDALLPWRGAAVATQQAVTLRVGAQDLEMLVPTLHTLKVIVPGKDEGTNLTLMRKDGAQSPLGRNTGARRIKLGDDERALFLDVPAGEYRLRVSTASMFITVPCGEVTFEAAEPDSLVVVRAAAGKPGAEAGLKANDVVTAVDGEPIRGRRATVMVMKRIAESAVSLSVQRGDEELNIEIGPTGGRAVGIGDLGLVLLPHVR